MSNIAGKSYGINVVTPIKKRWVALGKVVFFHLTTIKGKDKLNGLITLSLIHYARWVIIKPSEFPRLSKDQPKENSKDGIDYAYVFFYSNFNGSWAQYVDSFSSAISKGLDLAWWHNVRYPKAIPMQPFHDYIRHNQLQTNHYYNSYPSASANDVKAASRVRESILELLGDIDSDAETFMKNYNQQIKKVQSDLTLMQPTPIVLSLIHI